MNQVRGKTATIVAGACLAAVLIVVPSAQAAITISNITKPADLTWLVYNANTPNTFAVSGTANGTTGAHTDILCYDGDGTHAVASDVPLNGDGTFSTATADLHTALTYRICNLHAVPVGQTPADPSAFHGPRILVDDTQTDAVGSGPNAGSLYDFYAYAQQLKGGFDYDSIGGCGIDDSYLLDPTDSLTAVPFYCNDWLSEDPAYAPNRAELQIDGANAYTPEGAKEINPQATGFPAVTYAYGLDKKTGDFVIHETDPFVKCANATYPPTDVTCATFVPTGVTDHRTIVQDHDGRVAWITDIFTSTDAKAHKVDVLWQNNQHFLGNGSGYNPANVEYKFPGQSSYSTHVLNDTVSLPNKPGMIDIRMQAAPDGDVHSGRGAIVYDWPATAATFNYFSGSQNDFTLHQKASIPAHGSARFRFAYIQDFSQANVDSLAKYATTIFAGCTVPNVVGKKLATAKKAITKAHCAVGRIRQTASSTIAKGVVAAENPAAGTHVDVGTKVALVVSKG